MAPFELKLGQNESYGLQEPFKTLPALREPIFGPKSQKIAVYCQTPDQPPQRLLCYTRYSNVAGGLAGWERGTRSRFYRVPLGRPSIHIKCCMKGPLSHLAILDALSHQAGPTLNQLLKQMHTQFMMYSLYMHDSEPPAWRPHPQAICLDALSHQARTALNQLLMQCGATCRSHHYI